MRAALEQNGAEVLDDPEVAIAGAWDRFDEHGNLIDSEARELVSAAVEHLAELARSTRREPIAA